MQKRIGFVTSVDPFSDRKAWSGTVYKLREAIELAGHKVIWIPFDPQYGRDSLLFKVNRLYWKIRRLFFHKRVLGNFHSRANVRRFAQSIDLDQVNTCDYLFFPTGTQISVYLKTSVPIIFLSDATTHLMIDYYWFNVDKRSCRIAKSLEEEAVEKSSIIIMPSHWSLKSVVNDYKCDREKCFVLEFGPNVDSKDITPNPVYEGGRLNILFSGVDWMRKGGDIAVEAVRLLRERGLDTHLLIVGPKELPKIYQGLDYVEYYGFLNKSNSEEYNKYILLLKKSHMLLLPTQAECAGIVYCESTAFGIPSYTFATGGVTDYVVNNYNGFCFPVGSSPRVFADKIFDDIKQGKMKIYHHNALVLNKHKLSWESWAVRFNDVLLERDRL